MSDAIDHKLIGDDLQVGALGVIGSLMNSDEG